MNLSIIIPNLNGQDYLSLCLPSLLTALKKVQSIKYEVILVDNNSTDGSVDAFKQTLDNIDKTVIQNKQNCGFAPAINQGIAVSKYEYVMLLNNDIVFDSNWFLKISDQIETNNGKYAAYCGTVLTKDGSKYESVGLDFDLKGKCQNIKNGEKYSPKTHSTKPQPIWGSSAAVVIYHKITLNQVGGFDNDFFAYEEDVDVALRLHLLGYKTLLIPTAISYHFGGGTSRRMGNFRQIMDAKNWFFIIIKDYPLSTIISNLPSIIVERLRNFSGLVRNTSLLDLPVTLVKSYGQVLIYLPSMLKKRFVFQKLYDNRH